jgi:hypothetical protein
MGGCPSILALVSLRWYSSQTWPMSRNNFRTVFLAAPVMRTVGPMELPSASAPKTCTGFSMVTLFILTIMLERSRIAESVLYFLIKVHAGFNAEPIGLVCLLSGPGFENGEPRL